MTMEERIIDLESKLKLYPTMNVHELRKLRDDDLKILRDSNYNGDGSAADRIRVYVNLCNKFYKETRDRYDELDQLARHKFHLETVAHFGLKFPGVEKNDG